jgi:hypothetical protein
MQAGKCGLTIFFLWIGGTDTGVPADSGGPIADDDNPHQSARMIRRVLAATVFIALSASAFAQAAPPPPRIPELERPLLEFWHAQRISEAERQVARENGRDGLVREYLGASGLDPKRQPKLWSDKYSALMAWLEKNEPFNRPFEDERADVCAASNFLRHLTPGEIADVAAFFATPSGQRFWAESRVGLSLLAGCYQAEMRSSSDAVRALRAVGLKAPRGWLLPPVD